MFKLENAALLICLIIISSIISGCGQSKINLVKNGTVTVDRVLNRDPLYIKHVAVYEQNNKMVVSGAVRRQKRTMPSYKSHIDLIIISPDGKKLEKQIISYYPRTIVWTKRKIAYFKTELTFIPPKGSMIKVSHHKSPHNRS